MSEVYKVVMMGEEYWEVRDQSNAYVDGFSVKVDADCLAEKLNLAHAHATDAAARRVRELEEALSWAAKLDSEHKDNCPVPDLGLRAMYRQKWREAYARAALAGKERSDGAE